MSCFHSRRAILLGKLIQPHIRLFISSNLNLDFSLKLISAYTFGFVLSNLDHVSCSYAVLSLFLFVWDVVGCMII